MVYATISNLEAELELRPDYWIHRERLVGIGRHELEIRNESTTVILPPPYIVTLYEVKNDADSRMDFTALQVYGVLDSLLFRAWFSIPPINPATLEQLLHNLGIEVLPT